MKIFLLLLLFIGSGELCCQTAIVSNQSNDYKELRIVSYGQTVVKNENFLRIVYSKGKASYIKLFSDTIINVNGFKENSKYFDLNFEGDSYMWNQNFNHITLPRPFVLSNQNLHEKKVAGVYDIRRIDVYSDSTIYYYSIDSSLDEEKMLWGFSAKYDGDIVSIENQISEKIKGNTNINRVDSVVVFESTISKEGKLTTCSLIGGKNLLFADYVHGVITKAENVNFSNGQSKWKPAIIYSSGRPIETKIKLYVKFDQNDNVKIIMPKTLRNFTGY